MTARDEALALLRERLTAERAMSDRLMQLIDDALPTDCEQGNGIEWDERAKELRREWSERRGKA